MANINAKKNHTFDVIIVGSGISGGWAAKEFTEKGLKTLVLERGKNVEHIIDYPTANTLPWDLEYRGHIPESIKDTNPIVSRCYAFREDSMHFFVKDGEHPYIQDKPFDWIRGYQVGGKSLMWGRQTQRWSNYDFEGPVRDGFVIDWPLRYEDLAPWYSHVEKFVGISGNKDGLPQLPDGEFLPAMQLSQVENYFKDLLSKNYTNRHVIYGRCAHLTEPQPIHIQQGRGSCINRNLCQRGCPLGGYFSSNSSTLIWGQKTGNLTIRPHSVVHSIIYDDSVGKVTGVRVIDAITKESTEYFARIIFVNASTINTLLILLNSISSRFPAGLGNDHDILGKYLAFQNFRGIATAQYNGFSNITTSGNRPTFAYIPRFRNLFKQETDFLRGYAARFSATRSSTSNHEGFGENLARNLSKTELEPWYICSVMMGETIPKASSKVTLDSSKLDAWGIPLIRVDIDYDDNDQKMLDDYFEQFTEMFLKANFFNVQKKDTKQAPGLDIHEMGGARMGKDPKSSILNKWNQIHACRNVFVTDGACMVSTSTQNPSLTYMALTARAANYAINEMRKFNL